MFWIRENKAYFKGSTLVSFERGMQFYCGRRPTSLPYLSKCTHRIHIIFSQDIHKTLTLWLHMLSQLPRAWYFQNRSKSVNLLVSVKFIHWIILFWGSLKRFLHADMTTLHVKNHAESIPSSSNFQDQHKMMSTVGYSEFTPRFEHTSFKRHAYLDCSTVTFIRITY